MPAIWKTIPGYPKYQVSNTGRVRREGKLIKGCPNQRGLPVVSLYTYGRNSQITKAVSVLVLQAFIGPCPEGMEACHNDGDTSNNCLSNLRWDTHSNNVLDAVRHGTHVDNKGELNGKSRLSELEVIEIRRRVFQGETVTTVAQDYGLHREYVRLLAKGKFWKQVPLEHSRAG